MNTPMEIRLLAITPPAGSVDPAVVETWLREGVSRWGLTVLLRDPGVPVDAVMAPGHRFHALRRTCQDTGIRLLASCDSQQLEAGRRWVERGVLAGLQLKGDPSVDLLERARRRLGPAVLGRSCHGPPQGGHGWVDYTCFAPVFTPGTVQADRVKRPVGLRALSAWTEDPKAWVIALGGITPETAPACLDAGARGLGGISSFFGPPQDVAREVRGLVGALDPSVAAR